MLYFSRLPVAHLLIMFMLRLLPHFYFHPKWIIMMAIVLNTQMLNSCVFAHSHLPAVFLEWAQKFEQSLHAMCCPSNRSTCNSYVT